MRRSIAAIVLAAAALLTAPAAAQDAMGASLFKPDLPFDAKASPPAPDYRKDEAWAGLPGREDAVDVVPVGFADGQAAAKVDVFFVHPTTYFSKAGWNAPFDAQGGAGVAGVDAGTMRAQASAFNGCCRVYAPRYRQAAIYAFVDEGVGGKAAIDIAYQDVSRAFDEFLKRTKGRPFILAGHSQGSMHLYRLLRERVVKTALKKRLVAAYLIGSSATNGASAMLLPVCASARQTGCLVGWNAVSQEVAHANTTNRIPISSATRATERVCTNPLTWEDGGAAPATANLGAIHGQRGGPLGAPLPGFTGARCQDGLLVVDAIGAPFLNPLTRGGVYHIYDYNLFYMNLRANAVERAEAFLAR